MLPISDRLVRSGIQPQVPVVVTMGRPRLHGATSPPLARSSAWSGVL
jgi:hypothetical protein